MVRYTIQRLVLIAITLVVIISVSFITLRMMPGSFITNRNMPEDVRAVIEAKYHVNEPMIVQYTYFMKDFLSGDFGVSLAIQPKVPVFDIIKQKVPITLQLNIFSLLLTIPFAALFGITAALKKNTIIDHIISVVVIVFISVPSFVFASLLQYNLAFKFGWFPILLSTERALTLSKFHSMVLPILALTFGSVAGLTRYIRAELAEALNSDYMLLAKAKGLTQLQATVRHAIRNSFVPLAAMIISLFTSVLGGSLVIEKIFGIPGMGPVLIDSINAKDHTLAMGVLFFYSVIGLLSTLLIDLSYGIIDPRIRMGGKK
ncbi:MAG: peptide ABC transporter permease [Bacteroidetes bacterium 4572_77]|nr:MAG: peptide ABC transporter permease [Bacteroidetes bacterium 4572_77]